MARLLTRDDIQQQVLDQTDLAALSASTNPTSTIVVSFINESLQQLYAMLMEAYGDDYFTDSSVITTTAGSGYSSLPTNFVKLKRLFWRKDAETALAIRQADAQDLGLASLTAQEWTSPCFRLGGQLINWLPVPDRAYTVDLWYTAIPADLDLGTDTFSAGPGWSQWVVHDVCAKVYRRLRDAESAAYQISLRGDVEARIRAQAPGRNETQSHGVRDVLYGGGTRLGHHAMRDVLTEWED